MPRPATPTLPGQTPQANAPSNQPGTPPRPGEANRPEPQRVEQPGQANLPPVRDRNEHRPEPPRTGDTQRNEPVRG